MVNLGILSLDHPHAVGNHIPALNYLTSKVCVSAIYNENEEVALQYVNKFGAKYYKSKEKFLSDSQIDAVLITSKNVNHAKDCIDCANAGKDILCDKPISVSVQEALAIREAVVSNNVKFITTFPVRFNDAIKKTKSMIESGQLGEIIAIMATNHGCMYEPSAPQWVKESALNGGGSIIDHCVHVADIIRWFTNCEFSYVQVVAKTALRNYIDGEDMAFLQGKLSNGCIYQIDASWSRRGHDAMWGDVTFRIVGTKASASLDIYNNQKIEVHSNGKMTHLYPNNIIREHGEIFYDYWKNKTMGTSLVSADVTDGLRTIELAYAAYESLQTGSPVNIYLN